MSKKKRKQGWITPVEKRTTLAEKLEELRVIVSRCDGGCGGGGPYRGGWCTHDEARTMRHHILDEHGLELLEIADRHFDYPDDCD